MHWGHFKLFIDKMIQFGAILGLNSSAVEPCGKYMLNMRAIRISLAPIVKVSESAGTRKQEANKWRTSLISVFVTSRVDVLIGNAKEMPPLPEFDKAKRQPHLARIFSAIVGVHSEQRPQKNP